MGSTKTVTVMQGWKDNIARILRTAGATHIGKWKFDDSSTEVLITCRFKGSAEELQTAIWEADSAPSWVKVK